MHMQIWEWNMNLMFNIKDILQVLKSQRSTSTIRTIIRINNLKLKGINSRKEKLMMLNKIMAGGMELTRQRSQDLKKDYRTLHYLGFMKIQMKKVWYVLLVRVTMQLKWFDGIQAKGRIGGTNISRKKWLEKYNQWLSLNLLSFKIDWKFSKKMDIKNLTDFYKNKSKEIRKGLKHLRSWKILKETY